MCVCGKPSVLKQFYTCLALSEMPRYNLILSKLLGWHRGGGLPHFWLATEPLFWNLIGCGWPDRMLTPCLDVLLSSSKCPPSVSHCHSVCPLMMSSRLIYLLYCELVWMVKVDHVTWILGSDWLTHCGLTTFQVQDFHPHPSHPSPWLPSKKRLAQKTLSPLNPCFSYISPICCCSQNSICIVKGTWEHFAVQM